MPREQKNGIRLIGTEKREQTRVSQARLCGGREAPDRETGQKRGDGLFDTERTGPAEGVRGE